ncbi:hypothetical protein MRS44_003443 [Fusarium solani]|uniref:uncharacterized protein n=1 Tax=Fusarium solani TaxID=169388 RepID=UPI0032C42BA8|nr:hypothetical protein MRS44_003443 [Fusarium solani]
MTNSPGASNSSPPLECVRASTSQLQRADRLRRLPLHLPPPPPPPPPAAACVYWDNLFFFTFEIYDIKGWSNDGGKSLRKEEGGCGALTGWDYHGPTDTKDGFANFNLPTTLKAGCVERAIVSAGGPKVQCRQLPGGPIRLAAVPEEEALEEPHLRKLTGEAREKMLEKYGTATGAHPEYTPMSWVSGD